MNKNIVIVLGIIVIVGIAFFAFSGNKVGKSKMVNNASEVQNDAAVTDLQKEERSAGQQVATAGTGSYESYSAEKIAKAETGKVVLFFHATWCPTCSALNSDINKNISEIPAGVTILKTDYDEETELKKKYGVTSQHTLVQVDKDGNLIKKWSGGSKLENLLAQIK